MKVVLIACEDLGFGVWGLGRVGTWVGRVGG